MKKISMIALAALLCAGLALTACKGGAGNGAKDQKDYIAWTIYELIPKEELPDYCWELEQEDWSNYDPADVPEFDPTFFASGVEGHMLDDMDNGFYGRFTLKCYPLKDGGWRAYWVAYGGYDGLCGYNESGAYNYVDGELTREDTWILPAPHKDDLIDDTLMHELMQRNEYEYLDEPHLNYDYQFASGEDGLLTVTLDLDYLTYYDESDDPGFNGEVLDVDYKWNGERLVRLDSDGLDEIQMRAIAMQLGFDDPEEYEVDSYGGIKVRDPEEDEYTGRITYYYYIQTYPVLDDNDVTVAWKVVSYGLGRRLLSVYDFDGTTLTPADGGKLVADWEKFKPNEPEAFVWLYAAGADFVGPEGEVVDNTFEEYLYDNGDFVRE